MHAGKNQGDLNPNIQDTLLPEDARQFGNHEGRSLPRQGIKNQISTIATPATKT